MGPKKSLDSPTFLETYIFYRTPLIKTKNPHHSFQGHSKNHLKPQKNSTNIFPSFQLINQKTSRTQINQKLLTKNFFLISSKLLKPQHWKQPNSYNSKISKSSVLKQIEFVHLKIALIFFLFFKVADFLRQIKRKF